MEQACRRASEFADVIELRLDCLDNSESLETSILIPALQSLSRTVARPFILTFRPAEQGGYRVLGRTEREAFWREHSKPDFLFDIEADLVSTGSFEWPRVIVSHHDFNGVPDDLNHIYERLAATRAGIVKIAVQANDITGCLPVFKLLERARSEGRELIAIAMGNAGVATRILGPSRGAYLTYASLEDETATAPGQINARALRSVYRIDNIDRDTMVYGLVGLPVMHSVSPHMHNAAFAAAGVNGVYLPFETRDVEAFVRRMVHPKTRELDWNLRGLSVTAPHKSSVMQFLDSIEPDAREIGAVNTIVVGDDGLHGHNTDVHGLIEPLLECVGSLKDLSVAVIGAGGASRAAVWALKREKAKVTLFARAPVKARSISDAFEVPCELLAAASFRGYDVVINATPLGSGKLLGQTPAVAEQLLGAGLVYDLIYNPAETEFLNEARRAGCETLRGLKMLVSQARLQFELWTGKTPAVGVMHDAAAAALGA